MRLRFAALLLAAGLPLGAVAADLSVQLVVTASGRDLFADWERNPEGGFTVVPVERPRRGEALSAVVLFQDCAADAEGRCNAELDLVAYDPAGDVYGRYEKQELWRHRPAPSPGATQLGVGYMGLMIEPQDPAGDYRLVATARDLVSGKTATAEARFTVE